MLPGLAKEGYIAKCPLCWQEVVGGVFCWSSCRAQMFLCAKGGCPGCELLGSRLITTFLWSWHLMLPVFSVCGLAGHGQVIRTRGSFTRKDEHKGDCLLRTASPFAWWSNPGKTEISTVVEPVRDTEQSWDLASEPQRPQREGAGKPGDVPWCSGRGSCVLVYFPGSQSDIHLHGSQCFLQHRGYHTYNTILLWLPG